MAEITAARLFLGWRRREEGRHPSDEALEDDVLDAWLDEDEIDASGL